MSKTTRHPFKSQLIAALAHLEASSQTKKTLYRGFVTCELCNKKVGHTKYECQPDSESGPFKWDSLLIHSIKAHDRVIDSDFALFLRSYYQSIGSTDDIDDEVAPDNDNRGYSCKGCQHAEGSKCAYFEDHEFDWYMAMPRAFKILRTPKLMGGRIQQQALFKSPCNFYTPSTGIVKDRYEDASKLAFHETPWMGKVDFLAALAHIEKRATGTSSKAMQQCKHCNETVRPLIYTHKHWSWPSMLNHVVRYHNAKPSPEFIGFIDGGGDDEDGNS